jgi:four helix bundle protein
VETEDGIQETGESAVALNNFRDLQVWQEAHQLVLAVYRETKAFPKDEVYGLVSQMRRASVSVAANIAEGFKRRGIGDKARFYNYAEASLEELKYFFILSADLGYISDAGGLQEDAETVSKMLYGLIQSTRRRK